MMKKFRGILALVFLFNISFAQVQISEVAWMGTSASSYDEWIELYNADENPANLAGWSLFSADGSPQINLIGEIPAKSYFLLERTDDTTINNVEADQIYNGSLKNSGEQLILQNAEGEIIDKTPTGAWPAGENPAKKSMERLNYTISGEQNEAWQTFQDNSSPFLDAKNNAVFGTPKAQNSGNPIFPLPPNLEFVSHFDSVEIMEIQPVPKNSREIWFKFSIQSDSAVDLTNWEIKNTNGLQKLSELADNLILISGGQNISGQEVHLNEQGLAKIVEQNLAKNFTLPADHLIFLPDKAEVPLVLGIKSEPLILDDLQNFQIINNDEIIAEKVFAKDLQILISEISPNNETNDFVELFVKNADGQIDLKNMEIRHNGRTLFFAGNSLPVQKGDFLTFQLLFEKISEKPRKYRNTTFLQESGDSYIWEKGTKNGIVASSGTLEIILWSGTSWEKSIDNPENPAKKSADFVCWADKTLNKTETKRLAKNVPQNWHGDCFASQKLDKNESIARTEPQTDKNISRDFYHHLHGSPGAPNFLQNHRPHARIKLQSGEFRGKARVNFTGKELDNSASTDGDGLDDLVKFQWKINGKSCGNFAEDGWEWINENCYLEAQKYNPSYMYFDFENFEEFEISLRVTDKAGFSDTAKITISREKNVEEEQEDEQPELDFETNVAGDFFADFLAQTDLEKLKEIAYREEQPVEIMPAPRYLFARDKFSAEERSLMAKNIGLMFR